MALKVPIASANVLVVEDKSNSFLMIGRLLEAAGVQKTNYHWRGNSYEAISNFDFLAVKIDLILLDLVLVGSDGGYDVLLKLRERDELKDTFIVAVTGHTSVDEVRRAQAAGFDGFLGKPLDSRRFPGQLQRILSGEAVWEYV